MFVARAAGALSVLSFAQNVQPIAKRIEEYQGRGEGYRGVQRVTRAGYVCQNWTSQSPHNHGFGTAMDRQHSGIGDHNYCRNPDGEQSIWCYTTDPMVRWDYCDPIVDEAGDLVVSFDESTLTGDGSDYRGTQDRTISGYTCQPWSGVQSQHVHEHRNTDGSAYNTPAANPGKGLGNHGHHKQHRHHNFCRNPDGEMTIWCYTMNPGKRWEYCVPHTTPATEKKTAIILQAMKEGSFHEIPDTLEPTFDAFSSIAFMNSLG